MGHMFCAPFKEEEYFMQLSKESKNVLVYIVFLIVTVVLFIATLTINRRGESIAESPKLLPLITEAFMFILSISGLVQNIKNKGHLSFSELKSSISDSLKEKKTRSMLLAIGICGIYILSVLYIGFYISSFVLIAGITMFYVRRIKFYWAILIAAALTALLYLVFAVAFNMRLF